MQSLERKVREVSAWIDRHNKDRDPEAAEWGRLAKVAEEAGEVIQAFILQTGQNPRKPFDPGAAALVDKELLDVALTALTAWESRHGNVGGSFAALADHIDYIHKRSGLGSQAVWEPEPGWPKAVNGCDRKIPHLSHPWSTFSHEWSCPGVPYVKFKRQDV